MILRVMILSPLRKDVSTFICQQWRLSMFSNRINIIIHRHFQKNANAKEKRKRFITDDLEISSDDVSEEEENSE